MIRTVYKRRKIFFSLKFNNEKRRNNFTSNSNNRKNLVLPPQLQFINQEINLLHHHLLALNFKK